MKSYTLSCVHVKCHLLTVFQSKTVITTVVVYKHKANVTKYFFIT